MGKRRTVTMSNALNKGIVGNAYIQRGKNYQDENQEVQEIRNSSYSGKNVITTLTGGVRDYGGHRLLVKDFDADTIYTWQSDSGFDNIIGLKNTPDGNNIIIKPFFLTDNNLSEVGVSDTIVEKIDEQFGTAAGNRKLFIYEYGDNRDLFYPYPPHPDAFSGDIEYNSEPFKGLTAREINDDMITETNNDVYYDIRLNVPKQASQPTKNEGYRLNFVVPNLVTFQVEINGRQVVNRVIFNDGSAAERFTENTEAPNVTNISNATDFFVRMNYNKRRKVVSYKVFVVRNKFGTTDTPESGYSITTDALATFGRIENFEDLKEKLNDGYFNVYSYGRDENNPGRINKLYMYSNFFTDAFPTALTDFNEYELDSTSDDINIGDAQMIGGQSITLWSDSEIYGDYTIKDIDLRDMRHFVHGDLLRLYHNKGYAPPIDVLRSFDKDGVVSFRAQLVEHRNHLLEFETMDELNNYLTKAGFPADTTERAKYWFKTGDDEDVFADVRFNGAFADGNYYQLHTYDKEAKTYDISGVNQDTPYDSPAVAQSFLPNNRFYVVPFNKYVGYPKIMEITSNRVSIFGGVYNPIGWHCSSSFSIYNFIRASKTSEINEEGETVPFSQDTTVLPSHGFYRPLPAIPVQIETTGGIITIYTEDKPIILDANLDATKIGTVDFKYFYPFTPDKNIRPVGMDNMLFLIQENGELYTQSVQTYTSTVNEITLNHNPATNTRQPEEDDEALFKKYRVTKMIYIRDDDDYQKRLFCFCGGDNKMIIFNSDTAQSHNSYDLIDFDDMVVNSGTVANPSYTPADYKIIDVFAVRNKLLFVTEYKGVRAVEAWDKNRIDFFNDPTLLIRKTINPTTPMINRLYNQHVKVTELLFDFWNESDNLYLKNRQTDKTIGFRNAGGNLKGNIKGNNINKLDGTIKIYTPTLFMDLNRSSGKKSEELLNITTTQRLYLKSIRYVMEYTNN